MGRRLRIVRALGLVVGGIALAALLIEGGLRAMPHYLPRDARLTLDLFRVAIAMDSVEVGDPELGLKWKPGSDVLVEGHPEYRYHVKTYLNFPDAGFRGNVVPRPIVGVAVGDSFTFGLGVEAEEAWPELLSRLAGRNFANLGVVNYGPPQYTRVLQRYGPPLRPNIVLYSLYLDNDLGDAYYFARWQRKGGLYKPFFYGTSRFLARHLRLYQLLASPWSEARVMRAAADRNAPILQVRTQPVEGLTIAWEAVQQAILSAHRLADEAGAEMVVLLVPSKAQTYRSRVKIQGLIQAHLSVLDEYSRRVVQLCQGQGIRCLDLTPRFQERDLAGEQLYFHIDGHWNATGHRLAARTIYDYLVSERLLEGASGEPRGRSHPRNQH